VAYRVELLPAARREIDEAFEWYRQRSRDAADTFIREIDRGFRLISESPTLWPSFEAESRRYLLGRYPFSIIFRPGDDRITVIAVAHQSRKPNYWRHR
jgi:plasmid stabilization system protein ParE